MSAETENMRSRITRLRIEAVGLMEANTRIHGAMMSVPAAQLSSEELELTERIGESLQLAQDGILALITKGEARLRDNGGGHKAG